MIKSYKDELQKILEAEADLQNIKHYALISGNERNITDFIRKDKYYTFINKKIAEYGNLFERARKPEIKQKLSKSFYYSVFMAVNKAKDEYCKQLKILQYKKQFVLYGYAQELKNEVLCFLKYMPKLQSTPIDYKKFKDALYTNFPEIYVVSEYGYIYLKLRSYPHFKGINLNQHYSSGIRIMPDIFSNQEEFAKNLCCIDYDVNIDKIVNTMLEELPKLEQELEELKKTIQAKKQRLQLNRFTFNHTRKIEFYIPTF